MCTDYNCILCMFITFRWGGPKTHVIIKKRMNEYTISNPPHPTHTHTHTLLHHPHCTKHPDISLSCSISMQDCVSRWPGHTLCMLGSRFQSDVVIPVRGSRGDKLMPRRSGFGSHLLNDSYYQGKWDLGVVIIQVSPLHLNVLKKP